ncbi:MAG TPA: tetratricopeptide repeat protein [Allosphingosinicella sp.]|uniref:tetratricopeptide repeat protein n=1 Tax=Allosphingosinicella sp. TaxID=2823234 RepID=UPI002ED813D9
MKSISTLALAAALAAAGASVPAAAQNKAAAPAEAPTRKFDLSAEGRKAIAPLQAAVNAKDAAAYVAALPAAQAAAKTADDRYVIAQLQLSQAININDDAAKLAALEALLASGGATAAELPRLYRNIGALSYNAKNFDRSATALEKAIELEPNHTDSVLQLAEVRAQQKRPADAVALIDRAIGLKKAAGETVPETWYKRGLKFAYEGRLAPQSQSFSRSLVQAYPTADNWHDALLIFRQAGGLDAEAELDLLRLSRATKSLRSENDYYVLASTLDRGSYFGELQDLVREGTAAGKVKASNPSFGELTKRASARAAEDKAALAGLVAKAQADGSGRTALRVADGYFGHGDYAKAAELYRTAAAKGSIDTDLAKTRLGISLAMLGQKAEAEAAFKSVGGKRADLAGLWSLWLAQKS